MWTSSSWSDSRPGASHYHRLPADGGLHRAGGAGPRALHPYYLVQGFKGAADLNRDGIVSLQELYKYVEQQVTQKSRAVGGNQHPVMKGELEGVLPLVKVKGRP
jgi:hypothetical protein